MKKIFIIHENDEWLIPLEKELNILNAPYEKWHMNSKTINTNTNYNSIAENLSKLNGMKSIANFLNNELKKFF